MKKASIIGSVAALAMLAAALFASCSKVESSTLRGKTFVASYSEDIGDGVTESCTYALSFSKGKCNVTCSWEIGTGGAIESFGSSSDDYGYSEYTGSSVIMDYKTYNKVPDFRLDHVFAIVNGGTALMATIWMPRRRFTSAALSPALTPNRPTAPQDPGPSASNRRRVIS